MSDGTHALPDHKIKSGTRFRSIIRAMRTPEQERSQIAAAYAAMSDGELERVAAAAYELSEIAHKVLETEISRRALSIAIAPAPSADIYELNEAVTVRKFRDLPEALLAKGSLESAGIEAYLVDDNMVRIYWLWSNLLGGIKLAVRPADIEAATEILDQPIPETIDTEGAGEYQQPKCPRCQSLDINYRELNKLVSYGSMYFGMPIPLQTNAWTCHACHYEWEEQNADSPGNDGVSP
ncbi:MAG: hypothetical protein DMG80_03220 [Acidobacteria bacterium]|jgi:rubredoxin|nr:MAG: hypothetical protein DMG80_03220 [Acidobacteriota bacterium]